MRSEDMVDDAIDPARIPIAILSFNHPKYLSKTLRSLRAQKGVDWTTRRVALFQDNAVNAYSGRKHAQQDDIETSIAVFREVFPEGEVHLAEANLGVCENYLRAETWAFREQKAEFGYFFEDDMVLSPNYLAMLNQLAEMAADEPRIGYFSAYGKYNLPLADQHAQQKKLIRLEQHWGFGLTRSHWVELQGWLKPYYDMVVGRDYRDRPSEEILDYFRSNDAPVSASSQDDVKKTGTYMLGACSLNTAAVFARNIGRTGLNTVSAKFDKIGYAKAELFDGAIPKLSRPRPKQIDKHVELELAACRVRVERSQVRAALKPPPASVPSPTAPQSTGKAKGSAADLTPKEHAPPQLPAGLDGIRPLIEAADGRIKLGARQRGFAAMTAQDFMAGGHHLFEFSPISELFVQNQLSTLSDEHALALLKRACLALDEDARIVLHDFDEAEATASQRELTGQGGFHARPSGKLAELLSAAGFSDVTPHRYRFGSGMVREAFTPDLAALFETKVRGPLTGVVVSAVKRRALAPDFFNHSYTIRARQCVDEHFQQIPWFTYPAIDYLKELDLSDKRVFEYGCGNSTAFWSRRCKEVVSVDHNAAWVEVVRGWQLPHSTLLHEEIGPLYAGAIEPFGRFDIIVVDGKFRDLCADIAPRFLQAGGIVIYDNAERYPGLTSKLRGCGLTQIDFVGHVPLNQSLSVTSLFLSRDYAFAFRDDYAPRYRSGLHDAPARKALDRPRAAGART